MQLVRRLSDDASTDAMPFIVTLKVCAMKSEFAKWDTLDLVREWHRLFNIEPLSDGEEELASRGDNWDRFISEHLEEAALHERLVAVTEVLVFDRKVDPKAYAPSGARIIR
jgi:hypothetical protein